MYSYNTLDASSKFYTEKEYDEDGEENANNTAYTYGCATDVKSGNNVVRYTYDGKRRITAVDLNGVENYVTYAYEDVMVDGKKAEKVTAFKLNPLTS